MLTNYNQRKYNIPVTMTLLQSRLVTVQDQDQQLAKLLVGNPQPNLQNFAAGLIRECITSEPAIADRQQFSFTIEALGHVVQAGRATAL